MTDSALANPDISEHARFEALVLAHRRQLHKVVYLYCHHPEDQRDLMQDILLQGWRAFPSYDSDRPFATWMYRIALNVAISHLRGASVRTRLVGTVDPDELADAADASNPNSADGARLLHSLAAKLDPFDRALLLLYLDDRSQREIADILGISEGNVATRLSRLRQRLRALAAEPKPSPTEQNHGHE